jgi:cardiolipin synthase
MNIIDNNALPTHHAAAAPPLPGAWRDVHLRLAGPQLPELAESFDRSWRRAHGERLERKPRAYHRGHFESHGVSESIRFFDSGPGLRYSRAARVYTHMLRGARRSVTLSMAYFIPVGRVFRALLRARRRGVRLRIIVPGQSDVPLVQYATGYLYHKLVMRGFLIYERKNRMLHSKVMIVDGRWTLVGSANLDPRSLWTNLEFLAAIRSERLAAVMLDICRYEMERSRRLRVTDVTRLTPWARFVNMLAWSARWWL